MLRFAAIAIAIALPATRTLSQDADDIRGAGRVAGLHFSDTEIEQMLRTVRANLRSFEVLRGAGLGNADAPAFAFRPLGDPATSSGDPAVSLPLPAFARPDDLEDLAFASIRELASLVRAGEVTCLELCDLFLGRLARLDPTLKCVVSLLPDRARTRALELDAMLVRGEWLGPLHGIPFGAKDLLAAKGARTTWGAAPYRDQVIEDDAAAIEHLEARGAVLVAKLTLGALAWGDVWFGGRTRNPWNPEQGSSGSSAGPASATAAGAVPFAIGSETLGSIVSPATRCGVTGFRPTFGVVDTRGAMVLSWTMDKLGPLCRGAEDAAIVFAALVGPPSARTDGYRFAPSLDLDVRGMRVGYLEGAFERARADRGVLDELRAIGCELVPIELPDYPVGAMTFVLSVEGAAAFDELTRSGRDDLMVRQVERAWPNVFRASRLVPAVEYLQAMRLRARLMRDVEAALDTADIEAYVHPTHGNASLTTTNLTGHPSICAPRGSVRGDTPRSISFTGRLYGEAALLRLVQAWQSTTSWHRERRPPVR